MPSVQASVWIEASRSFLPRGTLVEIIWPARVTLPLYNTSHDRGISEKWRQIKEHRTWRRVEVVRAEGLEPSPDGLKV